MLKKLYDNERNFPGLYYKLYIYIYIYISYKILTNISDIFENSIIEIYRLILID